MKRVKEWGYAVLFINPKEYDYKEGIKSAIDIWFFETEDEAEETIKSLDDDIKVLAIVSAPLIETIEEEQEKKEDTK